MSAKRRIPRKMKKWAVKNGWQWCFVPNGNVVFIRSHRIK